MKIGQFIHLAQVTIHLGQLSIIPDVPRKALADGFHLNRHHRERDKTRNQGVFLPQAGIDFPSQSQVIESQLRLARVQCQTFLIGEHLGHFDLRGEASQRLFPLQGIRILGKKAIGVGRICRPEIGQRRAKLRVELQGRCLGSGRFMAELRELLLHRHAVHLLAFSPPAQVGKIRLAAILGILGGGGVLHG